MLRLGGPFDLDRRQLRAVGRPSRQRTRGDGPGPGRGHGVADALARRSQDGGRLVHRDIVAEATGASRTRPATATVLLVGGAGTSPVLPGSVPARTTGFATKCGSGRLLPIR